MKGMMISNPVCVWVRCDAGEIVCCMWCEIVLWLSVPTGIYYTVYPLFFNANMYIHILDLRQSAGVFGWGRLLECQRHFGFRVEARGFVTYGHVRRRHLPLELHQQSQCIRISNLHKVRYSLRVHVISLSPLSLSPSCLLILPTNVITPNLTIIMTYIRTIAPSGWLFFRSRTTRPPLLSSTTLCPLSSTPPSYN